MHQHFFNTKNHYDFYTIKRVNTIFCHPSLLINHNENLEIYKGPHGLSLHIISQNFVETMILIIKGMTNPMISNTVTIK